MPLVGSSAYNSAGQITALIRSLLNDVAANYATDTVLLPYVNSAYRSVQRKIMNAGGRGFTTDNVLLILPAVPANQQNQQNQAVINDATPPPGQLPSNLLEPLGIWERPNASTQDFTLMQDLTEKGGLPARMQGPTLGCWEFRTDGVYFIGATQDTQLRMRYTSFFQDLVGPNDMVLIRGAQEAIAYSAAGLSGLARGSAFAAQIDTLASDAIEDLISQNIRANQVQGVRRRPYGRRSGRRGGGWY